jgi:hypothetical protein
MGTIQDEQHDSGSRWALAVRARKRRMDHTAALFAQQRTQASSTAASACPSTSEGGKELGCLGPAPWA